MTTADNDAIDRELLRTAIAVHFWGKRVENNADKIADELAPELLDQFDIKPKSPTPRPSFKPLGLTNENLYGRSHTPQAKPERHDYPDHMKIGIDRTELIPGGAGAMIGHSNAHPHRQFLIIPQEK